MIKKVLSLIVLVLVFAAWQPLFAQAEEPVLYEVSPASKPIHKKYMSSSYYTKNTKQFFLIQSYLEELEKKGGGVLTLKKGTYRITNALFVPSDVTIILQDGVVLEKATSTGKVNYKAAKSMFQFIRPSLSNKKGVYGQYDGERNIAIIGEGKAVIDLKNAENSIAIITGHNQNVRIENIHFKNMNSGHFIEMDATENASVKNNIFEFSIPSVNNVKEAINLDTPDKATQGYSQVWSKFDRTPNKNVDISYNYFNQLDRAIGTHKYSEGNYHENISVTHNVIENMRNDAIRMMNWSNSLIEFNTISKIDVQYGKKRAILASGVIHPKIQFNTFFELYRPMDFMPWKNAGPGSEYGITYNDLSQEEKDLLRTNKVYSLHENDSAVYQEYQIFTKDKTERIYLNEDGI